MRWEALPPCESGLCKWKLYTSRAGKWDSITSGHSRHMWRRSDARCGLTHLKLFTCDWITQLMPGMNRARERGGDL